MCCGNLLLEVASSMDFYKEVIGDFNLEDNVVRIAITVVLLLVTLVLIFHKRKSVRSSVLIVGLSLSGKTQLFQQLLTGDSKETVISLAENEGSYTADHKDKLPLTVVDIPGSESIREQILNKHKDKTRGVMFVVDSSTIQKHLRDVAAYMYQILSDDVIHKMHPDFLIVCNKQDKLTAKGKGAIQKFLESEVNTVRKTQSGALINTEDGKNELYLGKLGEDFKFEHVSKFNVQFCEATSVATEENDDAVQLESVQTWMNSLK